MDYKIKLQNIAESCTLTKVPQDAKAFIASKIIENFSNKNLGKNSNDFVFIAKNDMEMSLIEKQIQYFAPDLKILNFYAWDCLPFDRVSPKPAILASRIKALYSLTNRKENQNFFIITSINAVSQKTISPKKIKDLGLFLEVGSKASLEQIAQFLTNKGYKRQVCANDVGDFALRGGIIDIVISEASDLVGYRIDFFGEEVESIRVFDPITQITRENVKKIEILPNSEVILDEKTIANFRANYRKNFGNPNIEDFLYSAISENRNYIGMEHWLPLFYEENLVPFFQYLQNPICFFDEEIFHDLSEKNILVKEYYQTRIAERKIKHNAIYNPISPELLYINNDSFANILNQNIAICFNRFDTIIKTKNSKELENEVFLNHKNRAIDLEIKEVLNFTIASKNHFQDPVELMKEFAFNIKQENPKIKISVACLTETFKERFEKLMCDYGINFNTITLPLNFGFYSSDIMIIGEQAIFGEKVIRKKNKKIASERLIEEGLSINEGELVVHRDYGIGKFEGIKLVESLGIKIDMIHLSYGGGDNLFVPVDEINLITRYGSDNPLIQLDRLGVSTWKNRREKVRKRIKIAAEELLKIAGMRKLKKAPIFVAEQFFYEEFKNRFGFVETEDQLQAIDEIEEDLKKGSPMDRLICGDVGFGKTEVAMRASAIVVSNNGNEFKKKYQVAIVAPTTLLVRQHYKNFVDRFANTNIKIEQLSRLISTAKAKEVRDNLENGKIDIVIGTHALLQKTIKFNNLGLVIIDEEQHFGVAQKERLKELRNEIHILTLSATPIPRTLQMSLTGVKDLSLIATPPVDRLAVRNFVMPYDSTITKEAIMREYNRGGRIFFVVPRISDIDEMEARLKILVPEIKITHAHGRMTPNELDKIMNDFVDGKIDMLLSTTIIESGIDISQANTMIIYKADMFGLSQLYQLRGRVGRTKVRGYCYFMTDNRKNLSKDSKKKLEVMQSLDSLGIGFSVASHDMDIRGSGNILGDEQSGHVRETGVELYQQMLLETIEKQKNQNPNLENIDGIEEVDFSTQIKLGISLLIPANYVEDLSLRMSFYKKIANIKGDEGQEIILEEMLNRFGKVPEEVVNLIEVAKLKFLCKKNNIISLEANKDGILLAFKNNKFKNPEKLMELIFSSNNKIKLQQNHKILFIRPMNSVQNKILSAFSVAQSIEKINN